MDCEAEAWPRKVTSRQTAECIAMACSRKLMARREHVRWRGDETVKRISWACRRKIMESRNIASRYLGMTEQGNATPGLPHTMNNHMTLSCSAKCDSGIDCHGIGCQGIRCQGIRCHGIGCHDQIGRGSSAPMTATALQGHGLRRNVNGEGFGFLRPAPKPRPSPIFRGRSSTSPRPGPALRAVLHISSARRPTRPCARRKAWDRRVSWPVCRPSRSVC